MRNTSRFVVPLAALLVSAPAFAQTAPIHGANVMDDKNRGGPDGWVQAPIPRTDAPSGATPGEGNSNRSSESQARPVANPGKNLAAGQDPGTPQAAPVSKAPEK